MKTNKTKRGFCILLMLCVWLLTSCRQSDDRVTCKTALRSDLVVEKVALSDGELVFQEQTDYPVYKGKIVTEGVPTGHSVLNTAVSWIVPEGAKKVTYEYEDIVSYTQCDILSVLREAKVPERCIPQQTDFVTEGYVLTKDVSINPRLRLDDDNPMNLHKGARWGSDVYVINESQDEAFPWMKRQFGLAINYEGELTGLSFDPAVWFEEPNSRVGDIPVYINFDHQEAPARGGWAQNEFFACFHISGYSCGLLSVGYTQQEFVDVLLAIINHYGAYPSKTAQ